MKLINYLYSIAPIIREFATKVSDDNDRNLSLQEANMVDVITQRDWTEQELSAEGFCYYPRKKQLIMARELTKAESPMTIKTEWDTLVATAGYMICYDPGMTVRPALKDYYHWPVHPDHFVQTYQTWDQAGLSPTAKHLLLLGCKPYYKAQGVWAKRLTESLYVQSVESPEPALIPDGAWLLIGIKGEPYHTSNEDFLSRYDLLAHK